MRISNSRKKNLNRLKSESFDLLVIGGGATGAGIALDAATRGYRVALVDGRDFASGTSSRSTKLIHGGVRYLERAISHLDWGEFKLVKQALEERAVLLKIAPHLTRTLPIIIPAFSWFSLIYHWFGMQVYSWLAGSYSIGWSHYISPEKIHHAIPRMDEQRFEKLKGGVLLYDGQFDDAKMNVSIIRTAELNGAAVANYVEVVELKKTDGQISGVIVQDGLSGCSEKWTINAAVVVNATGPFGDAIRQLDDPDVSPLLTGSAGTHILLDGSYAPGGQGVLIPKTSDGRVLFLLPWLEGTLVGTTDVPVAISRETLPTEEEITYLLNHVNQYLGLKVERSDVKSVWAGIRPLLSDVKAPNEIVGEMKQAAPKMKQNEAKSEIVGKIKQATQKIKQKETASISRDFKIICSPSGLYSVLGGKWTSYRKMAELFLDEVIRHGDLPFRNPCVTKKTMLAENYIGESCDGESFGCESSGRESCGCESSGRESCGCESSGRESCGRESSGRESCGPESQYVNNTEGYLQSTQELLVEGYSYTIQDVIDAVRYGYACTAEDILWRRTRLATLDQKAALEALPKVIDVMSSELDWDVEEQMAQYLRGVKELKTD